MNYTRLDWDCDFFGFEVCKINEKTIISEDMLDKILLEARRKNFRLCYLMIPDKNNFLNKIAVKNNGILVDEKVTYSINKINNIKLLYVNDIIEYSDTNPVNELYSLAIQSSHESRFRIDKNFKNNLCDDMYKIWTDKSISGEMAKIVFIFSENNSPKGFITLDIKDDTGKIVLIGVDINIRGKSIGKKLIHKSFEYFIKNGISKVDVDTQLRNSGACKFYEKCGFTISKISNIYHFWL